MSRQLGKGAGGGVDSKTYRKLKKKQSRQIRTEINDPALNKDGVLNVNDFLKSRRYEINELEKAQLNSKFSSSSRTFQSLPRKLRRRTASHNVKRIPKRMRNRAIREMANETSGIKKKPLKGKQLYRARTLRNLLKLAARANLMRLVPVDKRLSAGRLRIRQRIKTLNEQLQNSKDSEKFIKINNNIGSYDVSALNQLASPPIGKIKYMKRQRKFTWLSTHVWHSKRSHLVKRWGFQIPLKPTQKSFRLSHRNFNLTGAIIWDKSYINTMIIQSDNIQSIADTLSSLTNGKAIGKRYLQNGGIYDGLIYKNDEIIGTGTTIFFKSSDEETKRLIVRLHPAIYQSVFDHLLSIKTEDVEIIDTRYAIGSIDVGGPIALSTLGTILKPANKSSEESKLFGKLCTENTLPDNTVFTYQAIDPRLANRNKPRPNKSTNIIDTLIDMKVTKANINTKIVDNLLTSQGRTNSYENQLSLKQIAAQKNIQSSNESKDVTSFPVIIYKTNNNIWTVLLPWYWVLPVWHAMNHIAHMNHGGILQSHQLNFEQNKLFFPDDYPFTSAGFVDHLIAAKEKEEKWEKKPIAKKINYDKLKIRNDDYEKGEIGNPFTADWRYLQLLKFGLNQVKSDKNTRTSAWTEKFTRKIEEPHDVYNFIKDVKNTDKESDSRGEKLTIPVQLYDPKKVPGPPSSPDDPLSISPIKIELVSRGFTSDNARIYSIPEPELNKWIKSTNTKRPTGKKQHEYPEVPTSKNLIGFITSGSYNLSRGLNTGVGYIDATYLKKVTSGQKQQKKYCVIRNVGTDFGRLASWESIDI
ncbi:Ribonucleases P/MRP protein subunit [Wickerhamomyces ciferrii]|uniref:Ribonucleases P/MRP protein subunit n=1 Tax=Wickerhamomyces ciferrii (strain ATCC 14091 / BCRC 22168 / CBS 111 / JCM 3599 / NBRC 0793 / NRRL Y-1031 F-60-10) TaxID=1206466 RepID=K0KFY1_WICCF|nr:Ribonucleases P/MRP protein subunit [Wickerhamomyces ciferrii]CCH41826.1 Ribonucleases P/MRP protein subunit [Wickerhamomyces ciferrii]